jgi:hypothetical protein
VKQTKKPVFNHPWNRPKSLFLIIRGTDQKACFSVSIIRGTSILPVFNHP